LLSQAAQGFSWFKPVNKFEAGLFVYHNPHNGKTEFLRLFHLPGVSPSDFQKRVVNSHLFRHMDSTKVEECFNLMIVDNDVFPLISPILKPIGKFNSKLRYGIAHLMLNDFIIDCWGAIEHILYRMRLVWNDLRKPSEAEDKWYGMLAVERVKMFHFAEAHNCRENLKSFSTKGKNTCEPSREKIESIILSYDNRIKEDVKRIRSNHAKIIEAEEYSFFCELLMQITYPSFLEELYIMNKLY
jgi:hypothetical protein